MHKSGQSDVAGCSLGLPLNGQTKEEFSRRLNRGVGSHSSVHLCAPWPQLLLTNDQFNRKTILIAQAQAQGLRRCRGRRRHHQGPDRTLEVEVGSGSVVVRFGYVGFAPPPEAGVGVGVVFGFGFGFGFELEVQAFCVLCLFGNLLNFWCCAVTKF